jgi:hypothetical protein
LVLCFCTSIVTDAALAWQLARAVSLIHEMVPKVVMQNGDDPDGFFPSSLALPLAVHLLV